MKITLALIDKLLLLQSGKSIPSSSLKGEWVDELLHDGILINISKGTRRTIAASNPLQLENELSRIDERLRNLKKMQAVMQSNTSRSEQAVDTGNSKLVMVRSCPGFPINAYEPIRCTLNGMELVISPQDGTFLYVADWKQFLVPEDVIIVGVENMENFRLIRQQQALFFSIFSEKQRLLFVSRYPQSSDLRSWLATIPNSYVHFGDFDLAGINIFLTEYYKYLGDRASFLIPSDIAARLQNGSVERFNAQYQKFRNISSDIPAVQRLIDLINSIHKCYDQEGYIKNI